MTYYAGLDVSLNETATLVNAEGRILPRARCLPIQTAS